MPRISRYNHDTHALEWVDATPDEYEAWRTARAEKAAATRQAKESAPAGARAKGGNRSRRGAASPAGATGATDTLDDTTAEGAIHQAAKAAGKPKASGGPLTPIIGIAARFAAVGLIRVSHALTGGRHAMVPAEAISIAAPALRMVDRELGKRVRWKPAAGPNARDVEQIGTALGAYILRGVAGAQAAAATQPPAPMPTPARSPAPMPAPMPAPAPMPLPDDLDDMAPDAANDSDLFSGSEPVGKGATSSAANVSPRPAVTPANSTLAAGSVARRAGPPGAVSVPDVYWNTVSPPEVGLAEVMG